MSKVIALIRTSTAAQEIEAQRLEVINFIKNDGIDEEDIIVIGKQGASAIKLDEAYKENLNKVYDLISQGNISCVYAWGVDRIGRNEVTLMEFKNRLIENHVNLKIKNPPLTLLNDDGSVNSGIELTFTLFSTLAKQEMITKNDRFTRAKKHKAQEGKLISGVIAYGYNKNKDGYIIPNEEEAKIVKYVYERYATGEYSYESLASHLNELGYNIRGKDFTLFSIKKILGSKRYIGKEDKNKFIKSYQAIIDEETYNKVQAVKNRHTIIVKTKESKNIRLASGLFKCKCGASYFAQQKDSYVCYNNYFTGRRRVKDCNIENNSIKITTMDNLVWDASKALYYRMMQSAKVDEKVSVTASIEEIEAKMKVIIKNLEQYQTKKEKLLDGYVDGVITKKKYEEKLQQLNAETDERANKLKSLKSELEYQMNILSNLDNDSITVDIYDYINSDLSLEKKKEIVTKVIRLITMDVINSREKIITIHPKKGNEIKYLYDRYSMKCKTFLILNDNLYPMNNPLYDSITLLNK